MLDRVAGVEGIEWAGAFSSAVDATNAGIPDGIRVPVRFAYGTQFDRLGMPAAHAGNDASAWASARALTALGLPDAAGAVTLTTGATYGVVGRLDVPDFLAALEPVVLVPQTDDPGTAPVGILIVIAETPELVGPVSDAVMSLLAVDDPSTISVQTSEALAQLRGLIHGQLGSFSRGLVLALLLLTGGLVAVLLYGLVMMRRKDFGRRRALGATRGLIVALLLVQTGLLAATGILLGTALSCAVLLALADPLPGPAFIGALGILTLVTALAAALIPAIIASRRDPIRELRVP